MYISFASVFKFLIYKETVLEICMGCFTSIPSYKKQSTKSDTPFNNSLAVVDGSNSKEFELSFRKVE